MGDTGVAVNPEDEQYQAPDRQDLHPADHEPRDPHRGRRVLRDRLRYRRGEDDPRPRPQRLRGRPAPQPGGHPRASTTTARSTKTAAPTRAWTAMSAARPSWRTWRQQGYLVKTEDYAHNVGTCYRCHNDVEPLISAQWFVKMEPLAKEAIAGRARTARSSLCPSASPRPISTGWRTSTTGASPASSGGAIRSPPGTATSAATSMSVAQDPHASAKSAAARTSPGRRTCWTPGSPPRCGRSPRWAGPTRRAELEYLLSHLRHGHGLRHHLLLGRAHDLLRHGADEEGCRSRRCLIHGLVRDDKGRKMSKSLGNGIDPLEMAEKYGADALRFNLVTGNSPGNDMRFYVEKCEAMRNFANKIWNAVPLRDDEPHDRRRSSCPRSWSWRTSGSSAKLNTLIREVHRQHRRPTSWASRPRRSTTSSGTPTATGISSCPRPA